MASVERGPSSAPPGQELLERLGAVVFETDPAGNWTYLNPAWTRIMGFSVAETLGTNFLEYVHPEEREHTVSLFMAVVQGAAEACHHETRYRTKSGGYRWMELRATLLYDDDGKLVGNCGTLTDITKRRETENAIEQRVQLTELVAGAESFEDLPYGALLLDSNLVVQRASATARRLLGDPLTPGTKFGQLLPRFGLQDARGAAITPEWGPLEVAARTNHTQYAELKWWPFSGESPVWLQTTVIPSSDSRGSGELLVLLQDVTELRRAEIRQATVARLGQRALEAATVRELFDDALRALADVLEADFAELFVSGADGVLELRAQVLPDTGKAASSETALTQLDLARHAESIGRPVHSREVLLPYANGLASVSSLSVPVLGRESHLVLQAHSVRERAYRTEEADFLQAVGGVLGSAIQRRELEDAAVERSLHDPLTSLANRALLQDRLDQAVRLSKENDRGFAVAVLDLDRFKSVNDSCGHDVGDEVLRCVAARLVRSTRGSDTVARVGGDEFIVVLPGMSTYDDAVKMAADLHARLAEPVRVAESSVTVRVSVGVAVSADAVEDPARLLKSADVAMYEAKRAGTGCAVTHIRDRDD